MKIYIVFRDDTLNEPYIEKVFKDETKAKDWINEQKNKWQLDIEEWDVLDD
jgi:hypothetical protein